MSVNAVALRAMVQNDQVVQVPNTQCLDRGIEYLARPVNPNDQQALNDRADLIDCLVLLMHAKLKQDKAGYLAALAKLDRKVEAMPPRVNMAIGKQNDLQGDLDKVAAKLNEVIVAYEAQQKRLTEAEEQLRIYRWREEHSLTNQIRQLESLPSKVVWNITAYFTGRNYY